MGTTAEFDCENDVMDSKDGNIQKSSLGRSPSISSIGRTGLTTVFSSGSNNAPTKPFANVMAYNSIGGKGIIKGKYHTIHNHESQNSFCFGCFNMNIQTRLQALIYCDKSVLVKYMRCTGYIEICECVTPQVCNLMSTRQEI